MATTKEKFKKIDKEYQLTDSSVNCYGFRLLTSGYLQAEYEKNAIGYFMHERYSGVLLKWEDFRKEGDAVFAKPVINLAHYRAEKTIDEIEGGFLNAASVGHIVVLEYSDDPGHKLPNQEGPTVTKWFNRECSLVDIPGNFNSLSLFDADENPLNLADFTGQTTNKKFQNMKTIALAASTLTALNLNADADQNAVDIAVVNLAAKAKKVDDLTLANTNLVAEKEKLEGEKTQAVNDLAALKKTTVEKEVDTILETALSDGKITVDMKTKLKATYGENPEGLKDLVSLMPAYKSVTGQIKDKNLAAGAEDLSAQSWDDLHKAGKLENLKATDPETFKAKFKEKFKTDYKG